MESKDLPKATGQGYSGSKTQTSNPDFFLLCFQFKTNTSHCFISPIKAPYASTENSSVVAWDPQLHKF